MRITRVLAGPSYATMLAWAGGCSEPTTPLDELMAEGHVATSDLFERRPATRYIDSTRELQKHIGDEHTVLVLATTSTDEGGNYVIPKCATRAEEGRNPYCGQMTLGYGSTLIGSLKPEMDGPYPTGEIERPGPFIDCSAAKNPKAEWDDDDNNGWRLACLEMTAGVVWGVEIDNGEVDPQLPGEGSHRNAILVQSNDGYTLVGRTVLTDARRGVLHGANTNVTVWQTVVRDIELGGVFSLNGDLESDSPPKAVDDAELHVDVSSTRLEEIGNWAMLLYWVGGDSNDSHGVYRHVLVDASSLRDFIVIANNFQDPNPITNSTTRFEMHDSWLGAHTTGLLMDFAGPSGNANNTVIGELDNVTFANASGVPVEAFYDPWLGSQMILGMTGNEYADDGNGAGAIISTCNPDLIPEGCSDEEEPRWRLAGTSADFLISNDNFDISALTADHFTGQPLPP